MLVCGEPSGDQLGAQLMAGIRQLAGDSVRIVGVGGAAMAREGLESLFPLDATAVMGLREVVPAIPAILAPGAAGGRLCDPHASRRAGGDRQSRFHPSHRPRGEESATRRSGPSIMSRRRFGPAGPIAPRPMARYFDLVLALFPFEVPFFEKYGLKARLCRPSGDRAARPHDRRRCACARGWASRADAPLAGAAAGQPHQRDPLYFSRCSAPRWQLLAQKIPGLVTILPTVPHVAAKVRAAPPSWPTPLHIVENEADKFAAFDAADVALAASGTVTAELALSRTPMVVAYGWAG